MADAKPKPQPVPLVTPALPLAPITIGGDLRPDRKEK